MVACDFFENIGWRGISGDISREVKSLTFDSREVEAGSCFFAVKGALSDGYDYIEMAVERGAVMVVCDRVADPDLKIANVCYVVVDSVEIAMAEMAKRFYGDPSRELRLVGVTGTNGKTTTATLLTDLFEALGYATGLISTVVYRVGGREIASTHTTPDTIRLNAMLREMVDAGCEYCFMEVSSHSVVQERIGGLTFAGALFTNLTHDHLDYHGSFMEYLRAKKGLFDRLTKGSFALYNGDDRNGEVMVQNCSSKSVKSYSLRSMADLRAKVVEMHFDGMLMSLDGEELWVRLLGRFNAYNLLAAYGVARELGVAKSDILVALSSLGAVSGRFEHLAVGGRTVIVDYAHTPDALKNVLATIEEINCGRSSVITVCGCGGDRDRTKRAEMARIACEGSQMVVLTSDNPRTESPEAILDDMVEGLSVVTDKRWLRVTDRREAIRTAAMFSKEGDVILIAGKGHERYQIIGHEKIHFDDREVIKSVL